MPKKYAIHTKPTQHRFKAITPSGMPGTMMISPATWCEFFRPRLVGIIEAARAAKADLRVIYHSDGHFEPILDDLVEIGVNGINPVQPEHMDALRIRRRFGPRLALWGTVGSQTTFAFASPDEIRRVEEQVNAAIRDNAPVTATQPFGCVAAAVPTTNAALFNGAPAPDDWVSTLTLIR